ncbi:glycosyltransferase family 9 protein [Aeromonas hydrophila]|uniref:glycosyltransferase family 9 protein n=1 Tax=Aeromonas hydrophila TaxID=644 RepID=UPI00044A5635|nr:glycosyltransferase family 9 protein [Aeromonas hydrophila]EZH79411.1 heptosyltransferase [Aeromonas hydrophila AD9]KHE15858.1 heptosyltransferase [Aeromonas hydrophila]
MNLKKLLTHSIARWLIGRAPDAAPCPAGAEVKRVLVVGYDAIGDFILTLPAIARLRDMYPAARLELVCSQRNQLLAASVAGIDECHVITLNDTLWPASMWCKLRELRQRQYDLVINLFDEPDDIAMAKLLLLANGRLQSLPLRFKSEGQQKLLPLFNQKATIVSSRPVRDHFVYRMLSVTGEQTEVPVTMPSPCNEQLNTGAYGRYLLVNLTGSQVGNSMTEAQIDGILAQLPAYQGISYLVFSRQPVACPRQDMRVLFPDTILDAAKIIKDARGVISTDTSIIHISSSFGVPTLVLMNNERWRDAFIPLAGRNIILRSTTDKLAALPPAEISRQVDALMAL